MMCVYIWIFICLFVKVWQAMAFKNIIVNLNKGNKLNNDNYNTWHHKIWYVLEEQDCLEGINQVMEDLEVGQTAQYRKDQETYQVWKMKDSTICMILVSFVVDDIIQESE